MSNQIARVDREIMNELYVGEFWKLAARDTCFPIVSPTSPVEAFRDYDEYLDVSSAALD